MLLSQPIFFCVKSLIFLLKNFLLFNFYKNEKQKFIFPIGSKGLWIAHLQCILTYPHNLFENHLNSVHKGNLFNIVLCIAKFLESYEDVFTEEYLQVSDGWQMC